MRTRHLLSLFFPLALLGASGLAAQGSDRSGLSFAARAGAAIPLGDFGDAAGTGFHASLDAGYTVLRPVSVYVGYRYTKYPLKNNPSGVDDLTVQGPMVGIAFAPEPQPTVGDPDPEPSLGFRAHVGVYRPDVNVSGETGDFDNPDVGFFGGVRVGTMVGGIGLAASLDFDWCGTPWPRPFPPKKPLGGIFGLEARLTL